MDNPIWAKMHGGTTHFPIALLIASLVFDFVACLVRREPYERDLHAAGFYAVLLGALGSFAAVFSGLMLTKFDTIGTGTLGNHHLCLWPAFALLVGMAVWRIVVQDKASRPAFWAYLGIAAIGSVLMAAAGYWGGELLLGE